MFRRETNGSIARLLAVAIPTGLCACGAEIESVPEPEAEVTVTGTAEAIQVETDRAVEIRWHIHTDDGNLPITFDSASPAPPGPGDTVTASGPMEGAALLVRQLTTIAVANIPVPAAPRVFIEGYLFEEFVNRNTRRVFQPWRNDALQPLAVQVVQHFVDVVSLGRLAGAQVYPLPHHGAFRTGFGQNDVYLSIGQGCDLQALLNAAARDNTFAGSTVPNALFYTEDVWIILYPDSCPDVKGGASIGPISVSRTFINPNIMLPEDPKVRVVWAPLPVTSLTPTGQFPSDQLDLVLNLDQTLVGVNGREMQARMARHFLRALGVDKAQARNCPFAFGSPTQLADESDCRQPTDDPFDLASPAPTPPIGSLQATGIFRDTSAAHKRMLGFLPASSRLIDPAALPPTGETFTVVPSTTPVGPGQFHELLIPRGLSCLSVSRTSSPVVPPAYADRLFVYELDDCASSTAAAEPGTFNDRRPELATTLLNYTDSVDPLDFPVVATERLYDGKGGIIIQNRGNGRAEIRLIPSAVNVSTATYTGGTLAPGQLVAAFPSGGNPALTDVPAISLTPDGAGNFPTEVSGTSIEVASAGRLERAQLLFVSPGQINFKIPESAAVTDARAQVRINSNIGPSLQNQITIATSAPGFFTSNQAGTGAPSGNLLLVKPDGRQIFLSLGNPDGTPVVQRVGAADTAFLILYGTGIFTAQSTSATIGGHAATVLYAGRQAPGASYDQVNLAVPPAAIGGEQVVRFVADGRTSNDVVIHLERE